MEDTLVEASFDTNSLTSAQKRELATKLLSLAKAEEEQETAVYKTDMQKVIDLQKSLFPGYGSVQHDFTYIDVKNNRVVTFKLKGDKILSVTFVPKS
jgi:hypothetical protein